VIDVFPFPTNRFLNWVGEGYVRADGDLPEARRFDGSKRRSDPLDVPPAPQKFYVLEFRGFGEVKWGWQLGRTWVMHSSKASIDCQN
jgi:hypothetical protein